jgi:hypothetical protein
MRSVIFAVCLQLAHDHGVICNPTQRSDPKPFVEGRSINLIKWRKATGKSLLAGGQTRGVQLPFPSFRDVCRSRLDPAYVAAVSEFGLRIATDDVVATEHVSATRTQATQAELLT